MREKTLSHYPLGSDDYPEIDFSCNIKKTNVKFLERKLNWRGTCTPFSVWSMHGSGFDEPNWCTSNCGCFFRLDELTVRLVATIRWASILYRVWFQNKQWKRNDHWNLEMKLQFLMWPYHYILVLPIFWSSNCWWSALNWVARNTWTVCSRIRPRTHCYPSHQRGRSLINKILVR